MARMVTTNRLAGFVKLIRRYELLEREAQLVFVRANDEA